MGKIFYIMGKSSSGKDSIYQRLLEDPGLGFKRLVLYTTRPIRCGEKEGVEYHFVSEQERVEMEKRGKIIENRSYHTIHGIWSYFTVDDGQITLKDGACLGIGTLESYEKLKAYYGNERLCPIYIEVEDGERLKRAIAREELQQSPGYAEVCRRFLADSEDFSEEKILKGGITRRFENNNLEDCLAEIKKYLLEFC